jgi:hypothetical protein
MLTWRFFHRPIFVVGVARSGTTALMGGLYTHPHVIGARREYPFSRHLSHIPLTFHLGKHLEWHQGSLAVSESYLDHQCRRMAFEVALGRHYGVKTLLRRAARGDWRVLWKRAWCAKTYLDADEYRGVKQLYPNARLIYIIRNGCDVVRSRSKFASFADDSFASHCQAWAESVVQYRFVRDADRAIQVRQEDLVSDPEALFDKVLDVAGLTRHPAPARSARGTLHHPLSEPGALQVNVQEALASRPPAHADWTAEQRSIFRDICGDAMGEAGYEMPF